MTTAAARELEALRRPFRLGVVACFAALVCVGGIVAAYGTPADRAAGAAERWLVAVGDTTRDGLTDDALDRAREYGDPALAASLIPALAVEDDERAFTDLRVGRDVDDAADFARIPYELTPYEGDLTTGWVDLVDGEEGWTVVAVEVDEPGALAQYRIERPARASWGFWVGALVLGAVICAGCTWAVRSADRARTPAPSLPNVR
jgi:hypothetical protein